jgi:hypothetical protein
VYDSAQTLCQVPFIVLLLLYRTGIMVVFPVSIHGGGVVHPGAVSEGFVYINRSIMAFGVVIMAYRILK